MSRCPPGCRVPHNPQSMELHVEAGAPWGFEMTTVTQVGIRCLEADSLVVHAVPRADQGPPVSVGEPVGSGPGRQCGGRPGGAGPDHLLVDGGQHPAVHHQSAVDVHPLHLVAALAVDQ